MEGSVEIFTVREVGELEERTVKGNPGNEA